MNDSNTGAPRQPGTPFGIVDATVMRDPSLTANVKVVYACLTTYADPHGIAFPSKARLARDTGLSVRTVDAAVKVAETAGLLVVDRRKREGSKQNHVNRYLLRDHGRGYVPAAGTAGDAVPPAADAVGTARGAQEQDHRTGPSPNPTTSTSSDAPCAPHADARGSETAPRTPTLYLPANYQAMPEKAVCRWLVGAAVKAIEHAGHVVAPEAGQMIGRALRAQRKAGVGRDRLAEMLADVIAVPEEHGLVQNTPTPATPTPVHPAALLDPDSLDYCEELEALVDGAVGPVGSDTTALIFGMASEGRHPHAIYNAAIANERRGGSWAS